MKERTVLLSLVAAALIVCASLTTVVGLRASVSDDSKKVHSPLFSLRKNKFLQQGETSLQVSTYLGKGKLLNIFLSRRSMVQRQIEKAIHILESKPHLLDTLFTKIADDPQVVDILDTNDIDIDDFKHQLSIYKNNPQLLLDQIDENMANAPFVNDPMPTNLSTSNPIGCFIVVIALLPVFLILTVLIATLTIITCLNIAGCFEQLYEALAEGFVQELQLPGL